MRRGAKEKSSATYKVYERKAEDLSLSFEMTRFRNIRVPTTPSLIESVSSSVIL